MPRRGYVRKWKKGEKEACKFGHALTDENIVGKRQCRTCARAANARYKLKTRPRRTLKQECPRGHPRDARRPGRYDCYICSKQRTMARSRARGVRPRRHPTRAEQLAQRQKHEATRRARLMGRFKENVDRLRVYERASGVCGICQTAVEKNHFEVDHIIPLARGGEHSYANTQPAHPSCNRRKWAHAPEVAA